MTEKLKYIRKLMLNLNDVSLKTPSQKMGGISKAGGQTFR